MTSIYYCPKCKKVVERDGRARSIRSFCETVGRWVKIRKVEKRRRNTGVSVIRRKLQRYYQKATPEQVVLELEAIGVEFINKPAAPLSNAHPCGLLNSAATPLEKWQDQLR